MTLAGKAPTESERQNIEGILAPIANHLAVRYLYSEVAERARANPTVPGHQAMVRTAPPLLPPVGDASSPPGVMALDLGSENVMRLAAEASLMSRSDRRLQEHVLASKREMNSIEAEVKNKLSNLRSGHW